MLTGFSDDSRLREERMGYWRIDVRGRNGTSVLWNLTEASGKVLHLVINDQLLKGYKILGLLEVQLRVLSASWAALSWTYIRPLNSMGLKWVGPLTRGFFSTYSRSSASLGFRSTDSTNRSSETVFSI